MFYLGLDLGQRQDHTAIVIVERREQARAFMPARYEGLRVRFIERVSLGTPYPEVVRRVRNIVRSRQLVGQCSVVVDGTGVGAPVVEMLRAANLGCGITAVTITGGNRVQEYSAAGGAMCSVPKQDLIGGVQLMLEKRELKIAKSLKESGTLAKELLAMRCEPGRRGGMKFGADGYGEHDDLAMALALACWSASRKRNGIGTRGLPGI